MTDLWGLPVVALVIHGIGLVTSMVALLRTRTSQGAVAWIVSLNTIPWVAVPAWWLFGRSRFHGYVLSRRGKDRELDGVVAGAYEEVKGYRVEVASTRGGVVGSERLARMPLLGGNEVRLLVDGEETYADLFAGMEEARATLLVQFYIVRDDAVGRRLQEIMLRKAAQGVSVRFLFDGAGSYRLPERWLDELREGGVEVSGFHLARGIRLRSQLNFRNHRKIVVVDGCVGWVGGLNVGEEYLGKDPSIGAWRDIHARITGPSVLGLQLIFLEDWHWATGEVPDFDWTPHPASGGDTPVLMVPSGPADGRETASLLMQHIIHSSATRLWIATPYFVPDEGMMGALHLAQLRGVDVRILVPQRPDHLAIHLAAFSYYRPLLEAGIRVFRYRAGFLHSKTLVMDDDVVGVGTLNLDNRSLRLNFEVTALVVDRGVASRMEEIYEEDFSQSRELFLEEVERLSIPFRLGVRAATLLAPIL